MAINQADRDEREARLDELLEESRTALDNSVAFVAQAALTVERVRDRVTATQKAVREYRATNMT